MEIYITSSDGTFNATKYCTTVSISGDYSRCVRTLEFGIMSNALDSNIPVIKCELGNGVVVMEDGVEIFNGYIFSREKLTGKSEITLTCFDRGIYIKRNEAVYKFSGKTPEAAVARICADFGITCGDVASTGISISRKFIGVKLVDIISTMYTLASQQNSKKYLIRFDGAKLCVIERGTDSVATLDGTYNLTKSTTSESIENMINCVVVYDKDGNLLNTFKNADAISSYGLLQSYLRQGDEDVSQEAKKTLADNDVTQKITVENFGDKLCITGNAITVKEPYTGVYGLFNIDSDVHTWKKGQYYNKLVINFKQIMSEKESGSDD
ncbi:MAG: hypothetical protein VB018_13310 [Lachnospiraceae bacterium]|nr:hypothetical protein [Lachnospiraceae bacterium]